MKKTLDDESPSVFTESQRPPARGREFAVRGAKIRAPILHLGSQKKRLLRFVDVIVARPITARHTGPADT